MTFAANPFARSKTPRRAASALALACATLAGAADAEAAATCPFQPWTTYKSDAILKHPQAAAYVFKTAHHSIDADGAPTAYHPSDVGSCGATGKGLDCPANAGYPGTSWWPSVLAKNPAMPGKAYVQPSGVATGYFVSKTALTSVNVAAETDPARYVDASTVPYLVFPGPFNAKAGTGRLGDVGVAYQSSTHKFSTFIVADIGPNEPLGEASIALLKALGGSSPNPRNGAGVAAGVTVYVLFPKSVSQRQKRWPASNADIASQANGLLAAIGGPDVLKACAQ